MFFSLLVSTFISMAAFAVEPAIDGTSEITRGSFMDSIYMNLSSNFHGPNITHMDSAYTVDNNGKPGNRGMYFDSDLTTAYMIDPTTGIGPDLPFFYDPTRGQDLTIGDAGIKMFHKQTLGTPNFHLYTNLILQMPTSDDSKLQGRTFMVKTTPNFRYDVPDSRLAVGSWGEAKAYLGALKGKLFKAYAAPYVNYQLTPKLSLNVEYEIEADHFVGTTPFDFKMFQTDLCPGFVYMVTPKVLINPYLQVFTTDRIAMDHTAMGAVISASI